MINFGMARKIGPLNRETLLDDLLNRHVGGTYFTWLSMCTSCYLSAYPCHKNHVFENEAKNGPGAFDNGCKNRL